MPSDNTRSYMITDAHATPNTDGEMARAFQLVVLALRGEHGQGPWEPTTLSSGYWVKSGQIWFGQTVVQGSASTQTIRLPHKVRDALVQIGLEELGIMTFEAHIASGTEVIVPAHEGRIIIWVPGAKVVR